MSKCRGNKLVSSPCKSPGRAAIPHQASAHTALALQPEPGPHVLGTSICQQAAVSMPWSMSLLRHCEQPSSVAAEMPQLTPGLAHSPTWLPTHLTRLLRQAGIHRPQLTEKMSPTGEGRGQPHSSVSWARLEFWLPPLSSLGTSLS
jgi:hypothetical protein